MNKVMLLGRLTKDPVKNDKNSVVYCYFTIAVNRFKKGEADFIDVVSFNKTAEFAESNFKKGQQIALSGKLQVSNYERDGQKFNKYNVVADEFYFADSKRTEEKKNADDDELGLPFL